MQMCGYADVQMKVISKLSAYLHIMKIVSLLPSATEIVCALGLEASLVGRSHECDYPESIKHLPVCSEANFPDGMTSQEIDVRVKGILADALSVYTVNREQIKALSPD